jgi:hypothetical protein
VPQRSPHPSGESLNLTMCRIARLHLALHGRASIADLVEALSFHGFDVDDPAGKSISDALRWERRRGRMRRLGWGVYGPGRLPRGTEHRIHQRVLAVRADANRLEAGKSPSGPELWLL